MTKQETRPLVEICFTPHDFELYSGQYEIAVVIDVLRATSAICAGIHNGVEKIIPVSTIEEAQAYKAQGYLCGAERNGQIVDGFDFGNSPFAFMEPHMTGRTIVLTTTNGTRAINIASKVPTVVIGSLLNLDCLSQWLIAQGKPTIMLCSGWKDKFNLEDTICAGALVDAMLASGRFRAEEDSTIAAKFIFRSAKQNIFAFLKASSHRRRLRKLNLNRDVDFCLTPNTRPVIPVLHQGELVKMNL